MQSPRIPIVLATVLTLFVACHGKPGDDCTETPGSCVDKASHLVCLNKKYILETCKGQGACNDDGKQLLCDNTKADVGDPCGHDGSRACSVDGKSELRCRDPASSPSSGAVVEVARWTPATTPKCTPTGENGDTMP